MHVQYKVTERGPFVPRRHRQYRTSEHGGRGVHEVVPTEQIIEIADLLLKHHIDAVIATNTTLSREGVEGMSNAEEAGGLSGAPVRVKSTAVVKQLSLALDGSLPIIGVGGIQSGLDAQEKIKAGASLVQIYSGMVYRGPGLVREICAALG